jgi:hypothetical protein
VRVEIDRERRAHTGGHALMRGAARVRSVGHGEEAVGEGRGMCWLVLGSSTASKSSDSPFR